MALDLADGKPVVIFSDYGNGNRPTVMKWSSGTSWALVGGSTVTAASADYPGIVIDNSSNITVSFSDGSNSNYLATYRLVSGSWTSAGVVDSNTVFMPAPKLAIRSDGLPVILFRDSAIQPHVMKWAGGTSWTDLGAVTGLSNMAYFRLAIDNNDVPVVSFGDGSNSVATVVRWTSGNIWQSLGDSVDSQYRQAPIAIDPFDNLPYMLYSDSGGSSYPKFKKSNGTTFSTVGNYPFLNNQTLVDESQLVLDYEGHPFALMKDGSGYPIVFVLK
jgi:hypothetical protein